VKRALQQAVQDRDIAEGLVRVPGKFRFAQLSLELGEAALELSALADEVGTTQ
jgi:hypothetical protein